ncbi:MAG: hypothetical protein V1887_02685 [Candidatus Aenigmatarchaeota archaeon]
MGTFGQNHRYIERQGKMFDRHIEDMINQGYEGKYVAFEDGKVLDSDTDTQKLACRVHDRYGWKKPIYIGIVLREKDRRHARMPSFNRMRK